MFLKGDVVGGVIGMVVALGNGLVGGGGKVKRGGGDRAKELCCSSRRQ